MVHMSCPWCEVEIAVGVPANEDEGQCPECLTTWAYEDDRVELALAA